MTVTYTSQVASVTGFGCFLKLLFRWKGSIYKLVWQELLAYGVIYFIFSFVYRFVLVDDHKRIFERISVFCEYYSNFIPMSFVIGFYVSLVIHRWWQQFMSLPWPDALAIYVSTSVQDQDDRSRLMRRTVMRYVNLAQTITLVMISSAVKKRFPTFGHLVEAGLMTSSEHKILEELQKQTSYPPYWLPMVWACSIVARARREGRIKDDFATKTIIDEINRIRGLCGGLLSYDWISIPLVYTQVVTLSVYSFFMVTIMGRQFLDPAQKIPNHQVDLYIPVFSFLQFFFFMGWLKVAESLVNPFGEDDDDFEVNWVIDRNLQASYLIVDEVHNDYPIMVQDIYWSEVIPQELPYTVASEQFRRDPPQCSTANIEVSEHQQQILPVLEEEEEALLSEADLESGSTHNPGNLRKSSTTSSSRLPPSRPSTLTLLLNKVLSNSQEGVQQDALKKNASSTSLHQRGRQQHHVRKRSTSKISSASQTDYPSLDSLSDANTVIRVASDHKPSSASLATVSCQTNPPDEDMNQDDAIFINFKHTHKDVISDCRQLEKSPLQPNLWRQISQALDADELDTEERNLLASTEEEKENGTGTADYNTSGVRSSDNTSWHRKGNIANFNLKGLSQHHGLQSEEPCVSPSHQILR